MHFHCVSVLNDHFRFLFHQQGKKAPSVTPLQDNGWFSVSVMVLKKDIVEKMDQLEEVGATDILVTDIQNCRS